jgi:hypothetical protein
MNYDKYVLDLTNDSPLTNEELIKMLACALRPINGVDTGIQPMEDTMLDHLEQAREIADSGSEEKRILTEAWNEIAEHQKETGEWYE